MMIGQHRPSTVPVFFFTPWGRLGCASQALKSLAQGPGYTEKLFHFGMNSGKYRFSRIDY